MKIDLEQGTDEWLRYRKDKITATDAPVIMGESPWKSKAQLYIEKTSLETPPLVRTARMQRGLDLEPVARQLFMIQHHIEVEPCVIVKDYRMASLDGLDRSGKIALEVKCVNERDHERAKQGYIPHHYIAQLQHQIYVGDLNRVCYYSFDGFEGVLVNVYPDYEYIEKMLSEEKEFYMAVVSRQPPPAEYEFRNDEMWRSVAWDYLDISKQIEDMEKQKETLKKRLIYLTEGKPTEGAGVKIKQVERKGAVDYGKIPELRGVDLEQYRKESTKFWAVY